MIFLNAEVLLVMPEAPARDPKKEWIFSEEGGPVSVSCCCCYLQLPAAGLIPNTPMRSAETDDSNLAVLTLDQAALALDE